MRETIINIVKWRFPALTSSAEKRVAEINTLPQLKHLASNLISAQHLEQARQLLLDIQPE